MEQLVSHWWETACYLLDTCAIPLLRKAAKKVGKIEQLLEEKVDDQKSIIDLQQKLLKLKEQGLKRVGTVVQSALQHELKSVQAAVKTEMKSYSSAFTGSFSALI